jgi:hydrogenase expression/formation protein HypE
MPEDNFAFECPLPLRQYPQVVLGHGSGGSLMHQLIETLLVPALGGAALRAERHDGASLRVGGQRLAFTTDSYVVSPLFFPGGDIGSLAVNGTVNDLAMCGAQPLYLSAGFIIEEGLDMAVLAQVAESMGRAAAAAGVEIVTGDTKVVDRGKGDGLFVNTAGIGVLREGVTVAPSRVSPGDAVLLSGDLGRHGIAVLSVREGMQVEPPIESDCAPLAEPVLALLEAGVEVHCLRDLTRGGLASAMVEIAEAAGVHIELEEQRIPVREDVRGVCELLGFDPLYVANEGRCAAFVPEEQAERALRVLKRHSVCEGAVHAGRVNECRRGETRGAVTVRTAFGSSRILDMLSGEQLPRIC